MSLTEQLIGTWELVKHSQFATGVTGLLIYHPNGSMAVVIHGKRSRDGVLVDQTIAYAGTFAVEENCVVHHVRVSDNPDRVGVPQRRFALIQGNGLVLSETPEASEGISVHWKTVL